MSLPVDAIGTSDVELPQSLGDYEPPSSPPVVQLVAAPSPPPPPMIDYELIRDETFAERDGIGWSPLLIELVATLAVVCTIATCCLAVRWYRARKLRLFLAGLPDAAPDGTWLVVAFDWDATGTQSGRMPLDGISSMVELIAAAVDYGSEVRRNTPHSNIAAGDGPDPSSSLCSLLVLSLRPSLPLAPANDDTRPQVVDADICEESCDLQYMDNHGTERRVGAKTRFEDVKHARVLRISRKSTDERTGPAGSPHAPPTVRLGTAATRRRLKRHSKGSGGARANDEEAEAACLAAVPEVTEPVDEQLLPSPSLGQNDDKPPAAEPPPAAAVVDAA
jgi:hypothetical protein